MALIITVSVTPMPAYAAANALYNNTDLDAETIVRKSLEIASSICVYTNNNISVEKL